MTDEESKAAAPVLASEKFAHWLTEAQEFLDNGVPLFVGRRLESGEEGYEEKEIKFKLPLKWQQKAASPTALKYWKPDHMIGAVCGVKFDVIDVDPRNGGTASLSALQAAGLMPPVYGVARTPSGGQHLFVAPTGFRTDHKHLGPGIDLQAGNADGVGRGFVFIKPTIRTNKETGEVCTYKFEMPIDWDGLREGVGHPDAEPFIEWLKDKIGETEELPLAPKFQGTHDDKQQTYLTVTLRKICEDVADATGGERNNILNAKAFYVGRLVSGCGLDAVAASADLERAGLQTGLSQTEVRKTIRRSMREGYAKPIAPGPFAEEAKLRAAQIEDQRAENQAVEDYINSYDKLIDAIIAGTLKVTVTVAPAPEESEPEPESEPEEDSRQENSDEPEDDSLFPTYNLSVVLPGTDTYLDRYCAEALKADVPREFPLFAGLAALSLALGRNLALKHIEIPTYANLAICLTAGSASGKGRTTRPASQMVRKALPYDDTPLTSMMPPVGARVLQLPGSGEALIDSLDEKVMAPAATTPGGKQPAPVVIKRFSSPALVEFEEMQALVGKGSGNSSYKSYVINFADTLDLVSRNSKTNGSGEVRDGFVTFLTSTQPKHLRDQFTNRDVGSGLLNRFLFPFGKTVSQRSHGVPSQNWTPAINSLAEIRKWIESLEYNSEKGDGHWIFWDDWEEDARKLWIKHWVIRINPDITGEHSDLLGRMGLNMLRIILLFAANEMSERITLNAVRQAFALYDYLRDCALHLAREVRNTEVGDDMLMFLQAVEKAELLNKKPAAMREIKKAKSAIGKWNPEQLGIVKEKLIRAKMLFYVTTKSRTGKGRPGEAYTTSVGQWKDHPTLSVTSGSSSS